MSDVGPTPYSDIIPDRNEGLDRAALANKGMLSQHDIPPDERPAADIARQPITLLFCCPYERGANSAHSHMPNGHKNLAFRRRAYVVKASEWHHIPSQQLVFAPLLLLHAKGNDIIGRIVREIFHTLVGERADANNDQRTTFQHR